MVLQDDWEFAKFQPKRYGIEDFRQAFERKGMELDTTRKLGRGKYSKVYKAIDRNNNRLVAVKAIDVLELTADVKNKFLPREISCWRKLKNPFIVGLHAQYEAQNMIFLAMEYGSQGDLVSEMCSTEVTVTNIFSSVTYKTTEGSTSSERDSSCRSLCVDFSTCTRYRTPEAYSLIDYFRDKSHTVTSNSRTSSSSTTA